MDGYVVTVEVLAEDEVIAVDRLDDLLDRLTDLHGVLSGDGSGWSATVTVDADDAAQAMATAVAQTLERAAAVGVPTEPITRVEVVREDIRDAELERPTLPDLVSGPEAAEIIGVTRQRLHQLANEHPRFPAPAYRLGVGMLWHRAAVERFAAEDRGPGRPKTDRELANA